MERLRRPFRLARMAKGRGRGRGGGRCVPRSTPHWFAAGVGGGDAQIGMPRAGPASVPYRVVDSCLPDLNSQRNGFVMIRTTVCRAVLAGSATLILVGLSACGGGDHVPAGSGHGSTTAAAPSARAAPGAVFNGADVAFAQHMIVHHQQAVEMAALADTRAADPQVKDLANRIEAAQAPEIATMTGWLTAWGRPPATPDGGGHGSEHESMPGMMSDADMRKLAGSTGAAFDKQFLTMMIAHHEGAITMANEETAEGSNPDAKALAAKIVTDQQAEITTMKDLLAGR
ncbi:DUF305 domain-containing protein [Actinoplanes sp. NPDC049118]|uniref:DUF305 domain-containing protein n=1 Tax=Actinoplanes sp. NPDC049118 TaxID=3155769 RepID=UPI0033D417C0